MNNDGCYAIVKIDEFDCGNLGKLALKFVGAGRSLAMIKRRHDTRDEADGWNDRSSQSWTSLNQDAAPVHTYVWCIGDGLMTQL